MRSAFGRKAIFAIALFALLVLVERMVDGGPARANVVASVEGQSRGDLLRTNDPLAFGRAERGKPDTREANVPPQCYAKTRDERGRTRNTCFTCHTDPQGQNLTSDARLQAAYEFSDVARTNGWKNLFVDRRAEIERISDTAALAWIRTDNLRGLARALRPRRDYAGFVPDLDIARGFDDDGFAKDGSGWRAVRYKPFPGAFWPTNSGSTGDVFVRVPFALRSDMDRIVDEVTRGGSFPAGTEILHTVRYIDPDAPNLLSARLKELRYMKKTRDLDAWARTRVHEREAEEKDEQKLPAYGGSGEVGLANAFGWQLQAFIEDANGDLRAQTDSETRACMGCHGSLGITADHTFSIARKLPGKEGWRWQDLRGMKDAPARGHTEPEASLYMMRARAADDFAVNDEMLARFFSNGELDVASVLRAAPGGDRDLAWLVTPSRTRALALTKAYLVLVRAQSFADGRDATIVPPRQVFFQVAADAKTGLEPLLDARLALGW